jgi:hypothetical protein
VEIILIQAKIITMTSKKVKTTSFEQADDQLSKLVKLDSEYKNTLSEIHKLIELKPKNWEDTINYKLKSLDNVFKPFIKSYKSIMKDRIKSNQQIFMDTSKRHQFNDNNCTLRFTY